MAKDSFVFYKSFYDAIKKIPDEYQLELYNAILSYSLEGLEPSDLSPIAEAMFILIKPNIDSSQKRYETSVENGKRGGRPKQETQDKPNQNPKETQRKPKDNLQETQDKPNQNLQETQRKPKDNLQETQDEPNQNLNEDVDVDDNEDVDVDDNEDARNETSSACCPYQEILNLYHSICKSFPKVRNLSKTRRQALKARYCEYKQDINIFKELFEKAENSNFLKGQNKRNWSANFEWLINSNNMAKVLENNYKNNDKGNDSIKIYDYKGDDTL